MALVTIMREIPFLPQADTEVEQFMLQPQSIASISLVLVFFQPPELTLFMIEVDYDFHTFIFKGINCFTYCLVKSAK